MDDYRSRGRTACGFNGRLSPAAIRPIGTAKPAHKPRHTDAERGLTPIDLIKDLSSLLPGHEGQAEKQAARCQPQWKCDDCQSDHQVDERIEWKGKSSQVQVRIGLADPLDKVNHKHADEATCYRHEPGPPCPLAGASPKSLALFVDVLLHQEPAAVEFAAAFGALAVGEAAQEVIALWAEDGEVFLGLCYPILPR
jgi:hypothetical protein